jgi:hypothetical protein
VTTHAEAMLKLDSRVSITVKYQFGAAIKTRAEKDCEAVKKVNGGTVLGLFELTSMAGLIIHHGIYTIFKIKTNFSQTGEFKAYFTDLENLFERFQDALIY